LEFHQVIRNGYLELKNYFPERICIIGAGKNQEAVFNEIWKIIEKKLTNK